jgi:hypothetical protein
MSENITDAHVNALFDAVEGHTRVDPGYLLWGEIKKYLYEHELWALFDQSYHGDGDAHPVSKKRQCVDAQYIHDILCRDVEKADEGDEIMRVVFVGRVSKGARVRDAQSAFETCTKHIKSVETSREMRFLETEDEQGIATHYNVSTWCSSAEFDTIAFSFFHENVNSITRIICITHLYHKKITHMATLKCTTSNIMKT